MMAPVIPSRLLFVAGSGASAYMLSVGLFRWLTYEARTMETYVPLAGLALIPVVPLVPLALCPAGVEEDWLYPLLAVVLLLWDALAVRMCWRHFVTGPPPKPVDMRDKVVIVTGANTGIGRETARFLAEMGAQVVMACRSKARAEEAIKQILRASPGKIDPAQLEFMPLDVSRLASVRAFVDEYRAAYDGLDVLINNAGVMLNDRALTEDGLEATMATNHYGHFLLTLLLFPELEKAADGRIVNVSSSLHKLPSAFNFEDPTFEKGYSLFGAYAQSKLANVLFTAELQRRLAGLEQGKRKITSRSTRVLAANAVHPGNVHTEVSRNMPPLMQWGQKLVAPLFVLYQKRAPAGAYTTVHVATCPELRGVGGRYFVNSAATDDDVHPLMRDPAVGERLWEMSERAVGLVDGNDGDGDGSEPRAAMARRRRKTETSAAVAAAAAGAAAPKSPKSPKRGKSPKRSPKSSSSSPKAGGGAGAVAGASTPARRRSMRRSTSRGSLG